MIRQTTMQKRMSWGWRKAKSMHSMTISGKDQCHNATLTVRRRGPGTWERPVNVAASCLMGFAGMIPASRNHGPDEAEQASYAKKTVPSGRAQGAIRKTFENGGTLNGETQSGELSE